MNAVRVLLALMCGALLATASAGVGRAEVGLLPGIQKIVDSGRLTVAVIKHDLPPVIVTDKTGKLAGFESDLAKAIARDLGVTLEVRRSAETFDDVVRMVASGEADVGISFLSRTPRRAKSVLFTRPYLTQHLALLINRVGGLRFRGSCPTVKELLGIAGFAGKMGVRKGTANAARVKQAKPDAKVKVFDTSDELFAAVRSGDVAVSLHGELAARGYLRTNPSARIPLKFCQVATAPDRIGIAVGGDNHDLRQWLDVFLDEHDVSFSAKEVIEHRGPWTF